LNGSLYVALDAAVEPVTIHTTKLQAAAGTAQASVLAYLVESRWQVTDFKREETCGFSARAQGFGPSEMTWQVKPGQAFTVTARRDGADIATADAVADGSGLLSVNFKIPALQPLDVSFVCHDR